MVGRLHRNPGNTTSNFQKIITGTMIDSVPIPVLKIGFRSLIILLFFFFQSLKKTTSVKVPVLSVLKSPKQKKALEKEQTLIYKIIVLLMRHTAR